MPSAPNARFVLKKRRSHSSVFRLNYDASICVSNGNFLHHGRLHSDVVGKIAQKFVVGAATSAAPPRQSQNDAAAHTLRRTLGTRTQAATPNLTVPIECLHNFYLPIDNVFNFNRFRVQLILMSCRCCCCCALLLSPVQNQCGTYK